MRCTAVVLLLALAACGGGDDPSSSPTSSSTTPAVAPMTFDVDDVAQGRPIPARYSLEGGNVPPGLRWQRVPPGTRELAIVVEDPDAPGGEPFVHWLVAGIDPAAPGFRQGSVGGGAVEGVNGFGEAGWSGPAPPPGEEHEYVFTLLALDAHSGLAAGFSRADLDAASEGHILATAEDRGVFSG